MTLSLQPKHVVLRPYRKSAGDTCAGFLAHDRASYVEGTLDPKAKAAGKVDTSAYRHPYTAPQGLAL